MRVIWKYTIPEKNRISVEMQIGAKMLAIQMQNKIARIWVLVDPDEDKEIRTFRIFGTGERIPDQKDEYMEYVGTFQAIEGYHLFTSGSFVFHVFETFGESDNAVKMVHMP